MNGMIASKEQLDRLLPRLRDEGVTFCEIRANVTLAHFERQLLLGVRFTERDVREALIARAKARSTRGLRIIGD